MDCTCNVCIARATSPPSWDLWVDDFNKAVADGRIAHIANKPDGTPIWRWKG